MNATLGELEGWGQTDVETLSQAANCIRGPCKCHESTRKHVTLWEDKEEGKRREVLDA